jgi:hypothetical protein
MATKICLISYFTSPYQGVGTLRADYWLKNLKEISQNKLEVEMITATPNATLGNAIYVPTLFQSSFDQGLGWLIPLFFHLLKNSHKYDAYVFTGGPFLHFLLIPFIKLILKKKVIVDYRDPFANNPVFKENSLKVFSKKKLELVFNFYADDIVTVNKFCRDLLNVRSDSKISIIDNGFDETICPLKMEKAFNHDFILAGGFSQGRDVSVLDEILVDYSLVHVGKSKLTLKSGNYHFQGYRLYAETLGLIEAAKMCLLFTSGHPYESTTKIFDYLRFNKKVLIISDVIPSEGGLFEITKNNPNIVWSLNKKEDIYKAINRLERSEPSKLDTEKYSRRRGAQALLGLL